MMLTRLLLNAASRHVRRCLADSHALHALVMSLYPAVPAGGGARETLGVLHRLEVSERDGLITLLIQSRDAPDVSRLPEHALDPRAGKDAAATTSMDALLSAVRPGARFRFRLRANPTRRIDTKSAPDGRRRNGRRVPVRGDDARATWLKSRLGHHGLHLVADEFAFRQRSEGRAVGRRSVGAITHEAHVFDGIVEVVDDVLARGAILAGIGPGKAYGFGLLSLARV